MAPGSEDRKASNHGAGDSPQEPGELVVEIAFGDTLDLHGFPPAAFVELVESFLEAAFRSGRRHLRVIHGKGIGVQRERIRNFLARDPRVLQYGDLPEHQGGRGATWVTLRVPEDPPEDRERTPCGPSGG